MNFNMTPKEAELIRQIVRNIHAPRAHWLDLEMSLTDCHLNICPLDLQRMCEAGHVTDVVHDVYGIDRHIDKETGELKDCFIPRFALPPHSGVKP